MRALRLLLKISVFKVSLGAASDCFVLSGKLPCALFSSEFLSENSCVGSFCIARAAAYSDIQVAKEDAYLCMDLLSEITNKNK